MKFSFLVLQIIVKVGGICAFVIYVTVNFKPGKYTRIMFFFSQLHSQRHRFQSHFEFNPPVGNRVTMELHRPIQFNSFNAARPTLSCVHLSVCSIETFNIWLGKNEKLGLIRWYKLICYFAVNVILNISFMIC